MTVADSISGALRRFGRPMVLRRLSKGPGALMVPLDVTVYGRSKNYAANELIGGIVAGDSEVTITNAEIAAAQWPGPPRKDDRIIIDGKPRTLSVNPEPKYLGTDVLVYVCRVTG